MKNPPPELVQQACELFAPLGTIRTRRMFGGWGFYCDDLFFAIVADETLYLKADVESAEAFRQAGGIPFRVSYKDGREETMNYWTPPEEAFETPNEMRPWARRALDAAIRSRQSKKPAHKK